MAIFLARWTMGELIDTHAHLDDEQLATDLPAVLLRASAAGVTRVVAVATSAASSAACLALAERHSEVSPTAGIHPNHITKEPPNAWDRVAEVVAEPRVVGIGETGLDRHWDDTPFPLQQDYFARHLEASRRHSKPVVIHCREAEADVLAMLQHEFDQHGPIHGVMHSFTGNEETAAACLAMGLYLSFAGMLTYKNASALRAVAATVPLERLLVETDSPYLAPGPLRGKRNQPANVVHTAECLAGLHRVSFEEMAERTTRNARALFGF
jgi:TatD DNase family protein